MGETANSLPYSGTNISLLSLEVSLGESTLQESSESDTNADSPLTVDRSVQCHGLFGENQVNDPVQSLNLPTEEMSDRSFPDSEQPSRPNTNVMRYRRDCMQRALDEMNEAIVTAERLQREEDEGNPPTAQHFTISSVVLATMNSSSSLDDMMQDYGIIKGKRTGSVVITIQVTSSDHVKQLRNDYQDGTLLQKMKRWISDNCGEHPEADQFTLELSESQLCDAELFFEAGCIQVPIVYAYCPTHSQWYWTADKSNWQHITQLVVKTETTTPIYCRPQPEDEMILRKLNLLKGECVEQFVKCLLGQEHLDPANDLCYFCLNSKPHPDESPASSLQGLCDVDVIMKWSDSVTMSAPDGIKRMLSEEEVGMIKETLSPEKKNNDAMKNLMGEAANTRLGMDSGYSSFPVSPTVFPHF